MKDVLVYLFWPNPGNATYENPKALALLVVCGLLVAASIAVRVWRRRIAGALLRKFSRSWARASLWFGVSGLVLTVARVEQIQYLSMRFLWVLWLLAGLLTVVLQVRLFRARYYRILPTAHIEDPRDRYLPKRKR